MKDYEMNTKQRCEYYDLRKIPCTTISHPTNQRDMVVYITHYEEEPGYMYDSDGCGYPGGVDMDFFAVYCDEDSDFEEEVDLNESGVCEAIQDNLNRGGWE